MQGDQSNGAVIERDFTQIDYDVLTEHRQRHSFVDEFDSLDLIPTDRIQYHRSCYESYTSKINLEKN
jgi:hypothetical protein